MRLSLGVPLGVGVTAVVYDLYKRYCTAYLVNTGRATVLSLKWRVTEWVDWLFHPSVAQLELHNLMSQTALAVATEIGVFSALAKAGHSGLTKSDLAARLSLKEPSASILFHTLCAFGHLRRRRGGGNYTNMPRLRNWSTDSKEYKCNLMLYFNRVICRGSVVGCATKAFVENTNVGIDLFPASGEAGKSKIWYSRLADYPDIQAEFHRYMDGISNDSKATLAHVLRFHRFRSIIDFCGSTGNNVRAILEATNPQPDCTIIDLPIVIDQAKPAFCATNPQLVGKVKWQPFDLFHEDVTSLGSDLCSKYDLAMFLHTVVPAPSPIRKKQFSLAYQALEPGGWCLLYTSFVPPNEDRGPRVALKNFMHRIFVYHDWRFPTTAELVTDLRAVGFERTFEYPLIVGEETILMAQRPFEA
jgi:hypothetical protein